MKPKEERSVIVDLRLPMKIGKAAARWHASVHKDRRGKRFVLTLDVDGLTDDVDPDAGTFAVEDGDVVQRVLRSAAPPTTRSKAMGERVIVRLGLPQKLVVAGRSVTPIYRADVMSNGLIALDIEAPGLIDAMGDHDVFVRHVVENGKIVRVVDLAEKANAAREEDERRKEVLALRSVAAVVAKALGAKKTSVVDDDDDVPRAELSVKLSRAKLLEAQRTFEGKCVLVAADHHDKAQRVHVYPAMTAGELVARVMKHPFGNADIEPRDLSRAVDALVEEAGARVVHVSADTLVMWPTKKPKSLPKSRRLLAKLWFEESDSDEAADELVKAAKKGDELFFWWD